MDVDEDDDFYAPEDGLQESTEQPEKTEEAPEPNSKSEQEDEDLEEGEEEDEPASEGSDSVWSNAPSGGKCAYGSCRI
jgi:pre-mRNA 3'-end-processing factor FIP1